MKALVKAALAALVSLGMTHLASAGSAHYISAGVTGVSDTWTLTVPAGTVSHSYVVAQAGGSMTAGYSFYSATYIDITNLDPVERVVSSPYTYKEIAGYSGDYVSGSASIQAGIAGPPAGMVYLARVDVSGYYASGTDEKWATLVGGTYQVWHGGGTSGGGMVTAATDLTW